MMTYLIALSLAFTILVHPNDPDVVVTSLADSGPGSLRQTIADAPVNGTIRFAVEGDIVVSSGRLVIDKPLRILGGHQQKITVRAASSMRNTGIITVTGDPVRISDLTIRDGDNSLFADDGAGINNSGNLTLLRVTIRDNVSTFGGGIFNDTRGTLTLINCTVSGNRALDPGICDGGLGAGIYNLGTVKLLNTTITDNEAECDGGGITADAGTVSMNNTIIARNAVGFSRDCDDFFGGLFISLGFNLDGDGTCHLNQPSDLPGVDPLLGPLQDNGGPTDTHLPMAGSPAIDAGDLSTAPPRDQRGVRRPQGPASDIGPVEVKES